MPPNMPGGHVCFGRNPAQVRAFAKALGQRAKIDPIDAMVIARFAMATKPEIRPLPDEATRFEGSRLLK